MGRCILLIPQEIVTDVKDSTIITAPMLTVGGTATNTERLLQDHGTRRHSACRFLPAMVRKYKGGVCVRYVQSVP